MESYPFAAASAFWLGILTSISPCPLATNIAAISYIGKHLARPGRVALAGSLYTLGRMLVYLALGFLIVEGLGSIVVVSNWLQRYMNQLLGPLLIAAGLLVLDLIPLNLPGLLPGERIKGFAERHGVWGAALLGVIFALSFCPVSAALFFGSLIPLSLAHQSGVVLPSFYGIGTGLPVFVFALLIALSAGALSKAFDKLTHFELWARRVTGGVFILVGVYYTLAYIFKVQIW